MAKENSVIDWEKYGVLLRAARLGNGYSRGLALCKDVEEKTGMRISERTIYALEDASRAPSADIFLALQQLKCHKPFKIGSDTISVGAFFVLTSIVSAL